MLVSVSDVNSRSSATRRDAPGMHARSRYPSDEWHSGIRRSLHRCGQVGAGDRHARCDRVGTHDRADHEHQIIDESCAKERLPEQTAAEDDDVVTGLGSQRCNGVFGIAAKET